MDFYQEAEACRRQAQVYTGKPEARFLISAARAFESIATQQGRRGSIPRQS